MFKDNSHHRRDQIQLSAGQDGKKENDLEGRVPMDDMRNWSRDLSKSRKPFGKRELQQFFENHLATFIAILVEEGKTKDEVENIVLAEIRTNGNNPNQAGLDYVREAINLAFSE